VAEVAALTGFTRQTVTRMFEKEKGILILEHLEKMHKRGYPNVVYARRGVPRRSSPSATNCWSR
jgi:hypothetical protein